MRPIIMFSTHRRDSYWMFPSADQARNHRVVDPEGVLHFKVLKARVFQALCPCHPSKEDLVEPLYTHCGNAPLFGLFHFAGT